MARARGRVIEEDRMRVFSHGFLVPHGIRLCFGMCLFLEAMFMDELDSQK